MNWKEEIHSRFTSHSQYLSEVDLALRGMVSGLKDDPFNLECSVTLIDTTEGKWEVVVSEKTVEVTLFEIKEKRMIIVNDEHGFWKPAEMEKPLEEAIEYLLLDKFVW